MLVADSRAPAAGNVCVALLLLLPQLLLDTH